MLNKYTPQPNTMDMGSDDDDGAAHRDRRRQRREQLSGLRKQRMNDDQGTVRVDHNFGNGDTGLLPLLGAGEYGFMPEGLPGFGFYHDDFSQKESWRGITCSRRNL